MKKTVLIIAGLIFVIAVGVFLTSQDEVEVPTPEEQPQEAVALPAPGETPALPETSWVWVETVYSEGQTVTPSQPGSFVLSFIDSERFGAQTDCNNVAGSYNYYAGELSFGQMMTTKMACMNETQEAEFTAMLESVETVSTDEEGRLILGLSNDEGYLVFTFIEG